MKRRHSEAASFEITPDGKNIFLMGRSLYKYGSSPKAIKFTADKTLDPAAERAFMFDFVEREERERFYTKDMHGVDWQAMSDNYRRFLPHINNNYDFAELLSEWLGELNVSHTGGRYSGRQHRCKRTCIDRGARRTARHELWWRRRPHRRSA